MIKTVWINIIRFVLLILIQVLVLNNIQFSGYINPYLYVLAILLLPLDLPKWSVLFISLFTGLIIDSFSDTMGIHASASVFLAYSRPFVLGIFAPREGYDPGNLPDVRHNGFAWFLKYTVLLVVAHHLFLFFAEAFRFSNFFSTLSKALISSFFTLILIFILQMFSVKRKV